MRFLAKMGISPKTAASLQNLGHDAIHHLHDLSFGRLETQLFWQGLERRATF